MPACTRPRILRHVNNSSSEASNPYGSLDPEVECIVRLLPRLTQRLHAALIDRAEAWGLTPAQAKALLQVGLGGPMPVGELANALGSSMPATSEIVDRLVEAGYVWREDDPTDRRRVIVAPSDQARRFAHEAKKERGEQVRQALAALHPDQRAALVNGLAALVVALGGDSGGIGTAIESHPVETTATGHRNDGR